MSRRGFACVTTAEAERLGKTDLDIVGSFSRSVLWDVLEPESCFDPKMS